MKKIILLITCILALADWSLAADIVSIDNFRIAPGETKGFNISLNNDSEYVAFQFDLYLPKGISVESYSVDRNRVTGNTELSMSRQQDGSYRFITMSMDASPISGNSGSIIALSVKASDDLDFNGGTGYFRNVKLSKSNATGPTYQEFSFPIERIYYVVRYLVDGALFQTDTIRYGLPIAPAAAPYKEGYTFSGWSEIPAAMPLNDVEVSGTFSINSYTLTYRVDGYPYHTETIQYGSEISVLPIPTKDGFTFLGWSNVPATMPANNVDIVGHFIDNNQENTNVTGDDAGWGDGYNLTYIIDGQVYKTIAYESGATITAEPAPVKEGYTFSGWSEIPATMPANDVEVTGSFSINSYKLVYKVDGIEFKALTLDYGTEIIAEQNPTKEGYTFSGWSEIPATMPANDVEVTGSFNINSYRLVYNVDGAEYKALTLDYGTEIVAEPNPTKEGYTFSGWSEIPATMPANDVEVTGSFSINSYKLVYKVDGIEFKALTLDYGTKIIAEQNPTKEGYTFSGWSEIPAIMPANDVEITGSFSVNSYNLVYKVDGVEFKTLVLDFGKEIMPETNPTKEGFTFSGWSEIPATMPANDVEVVGYFTVNKYLLTVLVDNQIYYSDSIAYGTRLADYVELITQNGIDLSQWDLYNNIDSITMPAHDITINAVIDAVCPIMNDNDSNIIYDLTGKRIDSDDYSTLPTGIYIRNGRKIIVR